MILGKDVATEAFNSMLEYLEIPEYQFADDEEGEKSKQRLIGAFMSGQLEFDEGDFILNLKSPFSFGEKTIDKMVINEPTGQQLRSMSSVKKKNDDVGKAMAVLGDVTGLGLEAINKLKSRDLMVAVEVIGLFL